MGSHDDIAMLLFSASRSKLEHRPQFVRVHPLFIPADLPVKALLVNCEYKILPL